MSSGRFFLRGSWIVTAVCQILSSVSHRDPVAGGAFFTPVRAQSPVPPPTHAGKNLGDTPIEQAGNADSYSWKHPVAVLCTLKTTDNADSSYQTIPIAPGRKPADLCGKSHLAGFMYESLPLETVGVQLPRTHWLRTTGHPP